MSEKPEPIRVGVTGIDAHRSMGNARPPVRPQDLKLWCADPSAQSYLAEQLGLTAPVSKVGAVEAVMRHCGASNWSELSAGEPQHQLQALLAGFSASC